MNLTEEMKLSGEITIRRTDSEGNISTYTQPNLIVNEGLEFFAQRIFDKRSKTYERINPGDYSIANSDSSDELVNFHINEIAVGTNATLASAEDTYANQIGQGMKIVKSINNAKIGSITPANSFYYQADFADDTINLQDTLLDGNGEERAINEVLLIAKRGDYDSPENSDFDPRKLIAKSVLITPFIKYKNDAISISWKLQLK